MRTALIDADVLAVQAAIVNQKATRWGDEDDENALWTIHAFETEGEQTFADMVITISKKVGADKVILAFSDKTNWRKSVLPTYKANRNKTPQPLLRKHLTDWAQKQYECFIRPTLEGDDVLGILATRQSKDPEEEVVVCSIDKDFKTVPGHHFNFGKDELFEVTEAEADWWHLFQTLVGDAVDNYSGCPGVGPEAAKEFLDDPYIWVPYEHTFKSGPRKGTTEPRWQKEPLNGRSVWEGVVSCYDKAGLGEEEALVQARVARICRASDYDFSTKQVKLWEPANSK